MRDDDVPMKTQEGSAEIKNRALGLAPRIRTALLLVDGVKPVRELEQLLAASGVMSGALQTLLEKGLISLPKQDALSAPTIAPKAAPQVKPLPEAAPAPVAKTEAEPKPAPAPTPAPHAAAAATVKAAVPPPPKPAPAPAANAAPQPAPKPVAQPAAKVAPPITVPAAPKAPAATLAPVELPQPVDSDDDEDDAEEQPQFVPPPPPEDMKLLIARAHVANALDDKVEGYVLRQMVASCSSRAQLESLFDAAENVLKKSMGNADSARVMGIAKALLHS